ncbi:hypothetical protein DWC19_28535 [Streptomyces sp. M7]|nr:hypothetical protein DWC19_28535 [Streptomyces sp. M7]
MLCAFLHADPRPSSAADRVSIPPDCWSCARPAIRRPCGAPGRTFGWCSAGGREDLSRRQH